VCQSISCGVETTSLEFRNNGPIFDAMLGLTGSPPRLNCSEYLPIIRQKTLSVTDSRRKQERLKADSGTLSLFTLLNPRRIAAPSYHPIFKKGRPSKVTWKEKADADFTGGLLLLSYTDRGYCSRSCIDRGVSLLIMTPFKPIIGKNPRSNPSSISALLRPPLLI
jgi:hypothetical protein